jgi:hypothetical protein
MDKTGKLFLRSLVPLIEINKLQLHHAWWGGGGGHGNRGSVGRGHSYLTTAIYLADNCLTVTGEFSRSLENAKILPIRGQKHDLLRYILEKACPHFVASFLFLKLFLVFRIQIFLAVFPLQNVGQ